METETSEFQTALEMLNKVRAERIFETLAAKSSPIEAIERLVVPALQEIGQGWSDGRLALSQIYMSGRFCEELVDRALPTGALTRRDRPRAAIAVLNDYHMLGKRIVYALVRASGFELADYGRMDVTALVERTKADRLQVLMISTLMLPSALEVGKVRSKLDHAGWPGRLIVGGAPFRLDPMLYREVGADAMCMSAHEAVDLLRSWQGDPQ